MARTQATSIVSPGGLALGAQVKYEDALSVIQHQNYVFGNNPQVHLACTTAPAGWGTNTVHTLRISFEATDTNTMRLEIEDFIRIDPDVVNIVVGIRTQLTGADTGSVRVTVGGTSTTFLCTSATNGNEITPVTLATSATGTGWQFVTVELERTGGTTAAYLRNIRLQDQQIASSLPGPVND
jgi:hypothetical protein